MKFKLGKNNEWIIYGEDATGNFKLGIHFPREISKKKQRNFRNY